MSTEVKREPGKRGPAKRITPLFIAKTEIAKHLCVADTSTLDVWIAKGEFPPPHSRPGGRAAVWLRKHWDVYVEQRAWPKEAWPAPKG